MTERKPHLLHVHLDDNSYPSGVKYTVDCPYPDGDRPCGLIEECMEHKHPEEPESEMPKHPDITEEWAKYWEAEEEFEEAHVSFDGGWGHPSDECSIKHMIQGFSYEDGWEFEGFKKMPVTGPVKIDSLWDEFLHVIPWKESDEATNHA